MGAQKAQVEPSDSLTDTLAGLWFFSVLPADLIERLALISKQRTFKTGEHILEQGQLNDELYFLLSGRVEVVVDGGVVAHLEQRGDLLGEMSVISRTPCAATLTAEVATEILSINADEFQSIASTHSDHLQNNLNRLYAMVLADRLRITNQKAKDFEKLNLDLRKAQDELKEINAGLEKLVFERTDALRRKTVDLESSHRKLESQNEALVVSHRKLEELYNTRDLTFAKLETLYRTLLQPLGSKLSSLSREEAPQVSAADLSILSVSINDLLKFLEPITNRYSTEKSMRAKRVLMAEANKKQQVIARLALGGTGVQLELASTAEEMQALVQQNPAFDIILCDAVHLPIVTKLHDKYPKARIVLMNFEPIPKIIPSLLSQNQFPDIVSYDPNDRSFTVKNIMTTVAKLASGNIFGLEKYLSWGVEIHETKVDDSEKRADLIQTMDEQFTKQGIRRSIRDRINVVVEELLMNAIYDAPSDETGKPLYNHLSRRDRVQLLPVHQGLLRYAADGMVIAVSVSDPFGGLSGQTILKYLESCYDGQAGALNKDKGGAGRGLHQIIEMSDLVVFNVAERKRTEVIALFNVDIKESAEKSASFHLFTQPI